MPKEYSKELEKLQDKVQEFPFSDVKSIIEKDFVWWLKPHNYAWYMSDLAELIWFACHESLIDFEGFIIRTQSPDCKPNQPCSAVEPTEEKYYPVNLPKSFHQEVQL